MDMKILTKKALKRSLSLMLALTMILVLMPFNSVVSYANGQAYTITIKSSAPSEIEGKEDALNAQVGDVIKIKNEKERELQVFLDGGTKDGWEKGREVYKNISKDTTVALPAIPKGYKIGATHGDGIRYEQDGNKIYITIIADTSNWPTAENHTCDLPFIQHCYVTGEIAVENVGPAIEGRESKYVVGRFYDSGLDKDPIDTYIGAEGSLHTPPSFFITTPITEGWYYIDYEDGKYKPCSGTHEHTHSWEYSASGATLTATCNATFIKCDINKVSLTLLASSVDYTGSAYAGASIVATEQTAWSNAGLAVPTIMYEGKDTTAYAKSASAPKEVGTYKASIAVGSVEASADFEIKAVAPTDTKDTGVKTDTTFNTRSKKATVIVPNTFKSINKNAFHGKYVKKIVLPSTIKKIASKAFSGDNKLRSLKITSKKITISKTAFKGIKKANLAKIKVTVSKKMSKKNFNALKKNLVKQGLKAKNIVRK